MNESSNDPGFSRQVERLVRAQKTTEDKMENRKEISLSMNNMDFFILMSEGNLGALRVVMELMQREDGFMRLLDLDDMNIRGTQIWIGYKDVCGEKLDDFAEAVKNRDKVMIEKINEEGRRGNHEHRAVAYGASSPGGRKFLNTKKPVFAP